MSNFSFKGGTLYRLIPSAGIDLFIPLDSLMGGYNITGHRQIAESLISTSASQACFAGSMLLKYVRFD